LTIAKVLPQQHSAAATARPTTTTGYDEEAAKATATKDGEYIDRSFHDTTPEHPATSFSERTISVSRALPKSSGLRLLNLDLKPQIQGPPWGLYVVRGLGHRAQWLQVSKLVAGVTDVGLIMVAGELTPPAAATAGIYNSIHTAQPLGRRDGGTW
jgi:hypothetical protein